MPLCSFGGLSDQCGTTSWASQETEMVPLLSSEINMTEWLKEKYKGSGASAARGRPCHTKATGDSKYQLGFKLARKWLLPRSSGLFLLNRDQDILRCCRLKLFVCNEDFRGNLLGSCEEKITLSKLFIETAKGLTKILTLKGKSTAILSQQSHEPKTTI